MKTNDQNELLRLLSIFFDECKLNQRNFTNQNKVSAYLKQQLIAIGRWRNLPRGKHKYKPKSHKEIIRVCLTNARKQELEVKKTKILPDEPPF